jgi:4-amino-4-deoxychorismate lyase
MYGESVFTTMLMINSEIRDWEYHFDRLKRGVEFIYGPFTDGDDWADLLRTRLETKYENESGDRVLRLTIYREQARGLLRSGLVSVMDLKLHLTGSHFDPHPANKGLKLRTCAGIPKPHWWPSFLKSGNYLETILCQKVYLKDGDDDLLFLSPEDTVWESSVANIFIVRHDRIYTAPTGPNVLEGIMRKNVIRFAEEFFEECVEESTTVEQLYKADAIFGTNSIRGLFLIDQIDDHQIRYEQNFLSKFEALKKKVYR